MTGTEVAPNFVRKKGEQIEKILIDELHHRTNNMLAVADRQTRQKSARRGRTGGRRIRAQRGSGARIGRLKGSRGERSMLAGRIADGAGATHLRHDRGCCAGAGRHAAHAALADAVHQQDGRVAP